MNKYKGLFTFDIDNHRYIPIGQADGIVVVNDADYATAEPLIKDEEIISFITLLERFDRKLSKLCGEEEK